MRQVAQQQTRPAAEQCDKPTTWTRRETLKIGEKRGFCGKKGLCEKKVKKM
jgi:hypothetical protein